MAASLRSQANSAAALWFGSRFPASGSRRRERLLPKAAAPAQGLSLAADSAIFPAAKTHREDTAMNRLDGKIAFISGAARGIGAETARLMVQAGAKVAIGDVTDERGRETMRGLEAAGGEVLYVHLDVAREEDWAHAIGATLDRFGGLDILVNNAGIILGKGLEDVSLADWHRLCGVNL